MRRLSTGTALLVTTLLTIALTSILYLGNRVLGFPFAPNDLYDWLIGSGSSAAIAVSGGLQQSLAAGSNAAKADTAVTGFLSLVFFFVPALLIGWVFAWFVRHRAFQPDLLEGIIVGTIFGAPMALISITLGRSAYNPILQLIWYAVWFLLWGVALSYSYQRLLLGANPRRRRGAEQPDVAARPDEAARPDRRKFLLQLGASTAAITAISAAAGAALGETGSRMRLPRTYPVAGPEFQRAQRELYRNFRRFAIVKYAGGNVDDITVLTLGAEYPDHQYVSVWLGEGSPIVIYQNLETAVAAYTSEDDRTDVVWLD